MKNILIALFVICGFAASAQSTSPRFGTTAGRDNTYRVLTNTYTSVTDAAAADTTSFTPKAYHSIVRVALVDSLTFKIASTSTSYAGDRIEIIASGSSSKFLKFTGSNMLTAGTGTLSTNGRLIVTLIFDGSKWVEAYRTAQ